VRLSDEPLLCSRPSTRNAQTVKRRQDRADKFRQKSEHAHTASKKRAADAADDIPPAKRKKTAAVPLSTVSERKFGGVQSLIGKKRKEKKAKRQAGSRT
jgi:hypothetical protein